MAKERVFFVNFLLRFSVIDWAATIYRDNQIFTYGHWKSVLCQWAVTMKRCHGIRYHGVNWLLAISSLLMTLWAMCQWWTDRRPTWRIINEISTRLIKDNERCVSSELSIVHVN